MAVTFALIVIFLYILIRFKSAAFSAGGVAALVHDSMLIIGSFSLLYSIMPFSMEVDQSFIAAILTIIGYSINDTVVIFDAEHDINDIARACQTIPYEIMTRVSQRVKRVYYQE
jgi:preprotein translocase SecF subunit